MFFRRILSLSLIAAAFVPPLFAAEVLLKNGQPVSQLGGVSGSEQQFRITVPAGASNLVFKTAGGNGDCDLYVRRSAAASLEAFDERQSVPGNMQAITIPMPQAGEWFVMVYGFSNFTKAKVVASFDTQDHSVAPPEFSVAPGRYSGPVNIKVATATKGARIHFTANGSEPLGSSQVFPNSLGIESSTIVKLRAFKSGLPDSSITTGEFIIAPASPVPVLADGVPERNLAAPEGGEQLFVIDVPADQRKLIVRTEGGRGNTALYLRKGKPPTPTRNDARSNGQGNLARVAVKNPTAGQWFILVRALTNASGISLLANYENDAADLIVWPDALKPYFSTEAFAPDDCDVIEGHVLSGTRRLLRFNTETRNIGDSDIFMGDPEDGPLDENGDPLFEYHPCHGHYHFNGFARYRLLSEDGQEAALGRKVSFCLEDVDRWDKRAPKRYRYTCQYQGIQAGWSDIYSAGLSGQWIDVTGVAPGDYVLEITMNPQAALPESNYANNTSRIRITIDPPPVPVELTSGSPVTGLGAAQGNEKLYKITVPPGATKLTFATSGGAGDCDIYVKQGAAPYISLFDFSSALEGNNEQVEIDNPASGEWFVLLLAYTNYTGLTLEGTVQ